MKKSKEFDSAFLLILLNCVFSIDELSTSTTSGINNTNKLDPEKLRFVAGIEMVTSYVVFFYSFRYLYTDLFAERVELSDERQKSLNKIVDKKCWNYRRSHPKKN